MPFDPSLPADGSLIVAAELRSQLTSLKTEIDALPTQAQLSNDLVNCQNAAVATVLPLTSNNTNLVNQLLQTALPTYNQAQFQAVLSKLDELIEALRR